MGTIGGMVVVVWIFVFVKLDLLPAFLPRISSLLLFYGQANLPRRISDRVI